MEPIKSIAVPLARKPKRPRKAGHPDATPEHRVGGSVGPQRRLAGQVSPVAVPLFVIGQKVTLLGGGNRWAREQAHCEVLAVLPNEGGAFRYRVRSEVENYERVVVETDLSGDL